MTFGELLTLVRREIIVDEYEDAFSDADIRDALWRASVEVAAAFDFPRAVTTAVVIEGATGIAAPAACARVHTLSVNGDDARSADVWEVTRMQNGSARPVRYFNFDPRRGASILIAPPASPGAATIEYTAALVRPAVGAFDATEAWGGVLTQFHSLIAYRAGVALFQMDERENETQHWQAEYQVRAQELAAFLGRTDLGSLIVQPELRNDQGAAG